MTPEISVLLPVRDAGRYLGRALDDVLGQQDVALEVVAVDDGSTDASARVLRERAAADGRLRVLESGGAGAAAALAVALGAARAPLIAHMEADDRSHPERLARLRDALARHPDWDGVVSRARLIGAPGEGMRRYVAWQDSLRTPETMARARFVEIPALHQTGLYRRRRLETIGGYASDRRWPVDIDFWMRWFEAGARIGKVDRALYGWRQHRRQSTRTSPLHRLETLRACKAWYFVRGPARGGPIDVVSVGRTLAGWCDALRSAGAGDVRAISWRTRGPLPPTRPDAARLFAYGTARVRARVAGLLGGGDRDWFAA